MSPGPPGPDTAPGTRVPLPGPGPSPVDPDTPTGGDAPGTDASPPWRPSRVSMTARRTDTA